MVALRHVGAVGLAVMFVLATAMDDADARRGGGGGGMRAGGVGGGGMRAGGVGGGGMRAGGVGGGRSFANVGGPRPSHPIAGRPGVGAGWGNRPGGPGYGRPGYGYRPGYGWGAAAAVGVGTGLAYSAYDPYYGEGNYYSQDVSYSTPSEAVAECARRFKTYDPASQTYIRSKGVRVSCP